MGEVINIDLRGEVLHELSARVVGEAGAPVLEPMPGTVGRWRTVLSRHLGKGALRLVLARVSQRRSMAQNRLLWGVVYLQVLDGLRDLALERGETCPFRDDEDLHQAMKYRFIGVTVKRGFGETFEFPPTTTLLTIEQFSFYIRNVTEWAATKGVYVEMPESEAPAQRKRGAA